MISGSKGATSKSLRQLIFRFYPPRYPGSTKNLSLYQTLAQFPRRGMYTLRMDRESALVRIVAARARLTSSASVNDTRKLARKLHRGGVHYAVQAAREPLSQRREQRGQSHRTAQSVGLQRIELQHIAQVALEFRLRAGRLQGRAKSARRAPRAPQRSRRGRGLQSGRGLPAR